MVTCWPSSVVANRRRGRGRLETWCQRRVARLPGRGHLVILMTMSSTLPLAEVKAHLSELVSRVNAEHDRVTVTVHGRPSAMLLAVEDVEALEETIAILSDAETMKQLIEAEAEIARGEGETQEQLAEAMRRRRGSA
jgi:antitoxin YefM